MRTTDTRLTDAATDAAAVNATEQGKVLSHHADVANDDTNQAGRASIAAASAASVDNMTGTIEEFGA